MQGRWAQESPVLPSPHTSHCSQGSCKALKFQDSTCPPSCFGLRMDLVCFCSCSPDAINKELAMDKYSEVVNALCICSAFKICAWPVSIYCLDTRLPPMPVADPPACHQGCTDTALGARSPLGPANPCGLGRQVPAPQPSDLDTTTWRSY